MYIKGELQWCERDATDVFNSKNTVPKRGYPAVHITKRPAIRLVSLWTPPDSKGVHCVMSEVNLGKVNTNFLRKRDSTKNVCRI